MQELLAPNLWPEEHWREPSQRLAKAAPEAQRRVVGAVVDLALARNGLERDVADAREALRAGRFGDSAEREAVRLLAERLDEAYFDAQDAGDEAASVRDFRRARAASSVFAALGPDPAEATSDTIYEALHSLPAEEPLLDLLRRELAP